jgi:hypothetical protein
MELEEIRKRLVGSKPAPASIAATGGFQGKQPSHVELGNSLAAGSNTSGDEPNGTRPMQTVREALSISEPLQAKPRLVEAVDRVFRPVEKFRDHFTRLARLFEPIEEASRGTLDAFTKLGDLQAHLAELSNTFQLVKAFTDEMGKVAETFDPMRPLHEQLSQLDDAFYGNLADLAAALEPVDALKVRTAHLFQALDSIGQLEGKLKEVAMAFRPSKAQRQLAS